MTLWDQVFQILLNINSEIYRSIYTYIYIYKYIFRKVLFQYLAPVLFTQQGLSRMQSRNLRSQQYRTMWMPCRNWRTLSFFCSIFRQHWYWSQIFKCERGYEKTESKRKEYLRKAISVLSTMIEFQTFIFNLQPNVMWKCSFPVEVDFES